MSTSLTQRRVFEEFERSMKLLCHNLKLAIVFDFNLNIHYRNHQKPRQSYDDAIINIVQEKVRQKGAHNFCKEPITSIYPCYKIKKRVKIFSHAHVKSNQIYAIFSIQGTTVTWQ